MMPVAGFEPRGIAYAAMRATLAVQTLVVVVLDRDGYLFPAGVPRCAGLRVASLWCSGAGPSASRALAVIVLVAAAAGWRPRFVCVPHFYVTFSLAAAMPVPIGGDYVAQIATLLLVPICLGDRRRWHWPPVTGSLAPPWQGAAYASVLVLRLQVSIIYLLASGSKIAAAGWRDGSVLYTLAIDPQYGLPSWLRPDMPGPVAALGTWAAMVGELVVAVVVWAPFRYRIVGFVIGVVLHATIAVAFGLPTFSAVMTAVLTFVVFTGNPREGALVLAGTDAEKN